MAHPTRSAPQVAIPLPSDAAIRRVIGKSYDPERTLNVIKMFAGTEEMFDATIGLVKAIFNAQGIDPRTREMIILRAATVAPEPAPASSPILYGVVLVHWTCKVDVLSTAAVSTPWLPKLRVEALLITHEEVTVTWTVKVEVVLLACD